MKCLLCCFIPGIKVWLLQKISDGNVKSHKRKHLIVLMIMCIIDDKKKSCTFYKNISKRQYSQVILFQVDNQYLINLHCEKLNRLVLWSIFFRHRFGTCRWLGCVHPNPARTGLSCVHNTPPNLVNVLKMIEILI